MAKSKVTAELKAKAQECTLAGMTHAQTASVLGVNRTTLYSANYSDILDTIKSAENELRLDIAQDLKTSSNNGEVTAQIFLAKRLCLFSPSYKMPQIRTVKSALVQISRINSDLASGIVPPELAASLIKNIDSFLKALELTEMDKRLSEIEQLLEERK